ncbi:MAG: tail fiber domain-containing protein [Phycisphaerales bacterium]|nr:MAG: tail fiber domain-containing protein [Phycisphaerales bacterium]
MEFPSGEGDWTTLTPRQPLTAMPYALYALSGPGGGGNWAISENDIYNTNSGDVGVGTTSSGYPLHVESDGTRTVHVRNAAARGNALYASSNGTAVYASGGSCDLDAYTDSPGGNAIYAFNEAELSNAYAIYGENISPDGIAIYGQTSNSADYAGGVGAYGLARNNGMYSTGIGVYGRSESDHPGIGVYGETTNTGTTHGVRGVLAHGTGVRGEQGVSGNHGSLGTSTAGVHGRTTQEDHYAVWGQANENGFAGYFTGGRNYFEGSVGIGTSTPQTNLDVVGTVRATGIQLTASPAAGYVLATDADGTGSWQPDGLTLPYEGSDSIFAAPAFKIENTGGGQAVYGKSSTSMGFAHGVYGEAHGSASQNVCYGVYGRSDGAGYICGVYGYGEASIPMSTAYGVVGKCRSLSAAAGSYAVYAENEGTSGYAGYFKGPDPTDIDDAQHAIAGAEETGEANTGGSLVFRGHGGPGDSARAWATIRGMKESGVAGSKASYLAFATRSDEVDLTERMRITSSGYVGVGRSNPAGFRLAVNGRAAKPGGGAWSVYSDARLKEDIAPLTGTLTRLLALRGVMFKYKNPNHKLGLLGRQVGLIAQQVEEVFPEWVDEDVDGYKYVTVRGFEALAVEALRELREEKDAEIEALRSESAALRVRVAALEATVAKLDNSMN